MLRRLVKTLVVGLLALFLPCLDAQAQPVCAPSSVTTSGTVTLGWDRAVQPAGVVETAYLFEYQTDGGTWAMVPTPPLSATTATDTLAIGPVYAYRLRVQGTLADGTTAVSSFASHGTPPPCVQNMAVGNAPTAFLATPQCLACSVAILLTWESADATKKVRLERRKASVATWTLLKNNVVGTAYTNINLTRDTTYCYRARYVSGSVWTPEACATTE